MSDKKKASSARQATATAKISKAELAELLKKAEQEDPEADQNIDAPEPPKKKPAKK
jgi:hypothetical protein